MCINVGSFLGPLICGYLGQKISWHLGFGAAAVGMFLGLIVYVLGYPVMGNIGHLVIDKNHHAQKRRNISQLLGGSGAVVAALGLLAALHYSGVWHITFDSLQYLLGIFLIILPIVYFGMLFWKGGWSRTERNHLIVLGLFYVFSIFFWAANEQQGSLLNIFADKVTNCSLFGWSFPSSWFQSFDPAFIILLTPLFAWLWPALGKRDPSTPAKFSIAIALNAAAFLVMVGAALVAGPHRQPVGPGWLTVNMLLLTVGELCLSPVGLAAFARLAPARIASQMMGIWFLNDSLASLMAGAAGGAYEHVSLATNFLWTAVGSLIVAAALVLTTPYIKRLMGSVK
jgi:POT family proton-dependent oligopeptide transporter